MQQHNLGVMNEHVRFASHQKKINICASFALLFSFPTFPCGRMLPNNEERDVTRAYHNSKSHHGLWLPTAPSGATPVLILGVDYVPDLQDSE
jgi:hypothetical protein